MGIASVNHHNTLWSKILLFKKPSFHYKNIFKAPEHIRQYFSSTVGHLFTHSLSSNKFHQAPYYVYTCVGAVELVMTTECRSIQHERLTLFPSTCGLPTFCAARYELPDRNCVVCGHPTASYGYNEETHYHSYRQSFCHHHEILFRRVPGQ